MSHRTYDRTWREAMEELVELSHSDDPSDPKIQKDLHGWSVMYLRYLRAFQRLNVASSHIIQAQKRKDLRRCLECCMARMLEIRAHLVTLNRGMDIMSFEPAVTELKLTPEALDIPVPGFLVHRPPQAELDKFGEAEDHSSKENLPGNIAENGSSEPLTDAIAKAMTQVVGGQQAATKIQTAARGLLDRMHAARAAEQELLFLNMKRQRPPAGAQKVHRESTKAAEEKIALAQQDADVAYQAALVAEQAEVALLEGPGMREEIQGKINDWLLRARDANPGELPALPSASEGGSRAILQEAAAAAQNVMPPAATKGPAKGPGKAAQPPARRGKDAEKAAAAVVDNMPRLALPDLMDTIKRWQDVWDNRPEPELGAWEAVQLDKQLLKAEVRPGVFEGIRMQADEETRLLLTNLKELANAEAAASGKSKAAKKDAGGSKAKAAKPAQAPKEQKAANPKPADAKRKDLTADRTLESLKEELEEQGLLTETSEVKIEDFLAAYCYAQRGQKPGDIDSEPSLLTIRNRLIELCVLPLLSTYVRTRVPMTKALLLYGAPGSGKTMLAHAMAHASGARLFDISPRQVEGKYTGKAVTMMLHMVFKVAREMGPAVIYFNEAEKVFAADKRRAEEVEGSEPPSRMKRDLLQEIQALQPADRVVVIGCASEPYSCTKKDSESLLAAFGKHFYIPLPDYATRQAMWTAALDRCPCQVEDRFDLASVSLLSEGQTAASISQIVQSAAARHHGTKQPLTSDDIKAELTQHPAAAALQCFEQLLEWQKSTPVYKSILEGDDDSVTNQAKTASSRKRT